MSDLKCGRSEWISHDGHFCANFRSLLALSLELSSNHASLVPALAMSIEFEI